MSKGFLDEITIQDFPLCGKFVYLHIKRRRWTNKTNGEIIKRDWTLVTNEINLKEVLPNSNKGYRSIPCSKVSFRSFTGNQNQTSMGSYGF
jgi:hypothetical protein